MPRSQQNSIPFQCRVDGFFYLSIYRIYSRKWFFTHSQMACSAQWNFVNDFLWFTLKHPTEKYTFALFNPFFFSIGMATQPTMLRLKSVYYSCGCNVGKINLSWNIRICCLVGTGSNKWKLLLLQSSQSMRVERAKRRFLPKKAEEFSKNKYQTISLACIDLSCNITHTTRVRKELRRPYYITKPFHTRFLLIAPSLDN